MGEVVNLRQARKRAARAAKEAEAASNRAAFGRSATAKTQSRLERDRAVDHLDGHRLDRTDGDASD